MLSELFLKWIRWLFIFSIIKKVNVAYLFILVFVKFEGILPKEFFNIKKKADFDR